MPVLAAGAAIVGGMGVVATAPLWGGLMIAGGVFTGIGYLTGSENMMKMGAVMGVAGGIGGWASGAFSAAAGEAAGGAAGAEAAAGADAAAAAQNATAGATSSANAAPTVAQQVINPTGAGMTVESALAAPAYTGGSAIPSGAEAVAGAGADGKGLINALMPKSDSSKLLLGNTLSGAAEGYFDDKATKRAENIAQQNVDLNKEELDFRKMQDSRAYQNAQVGDNIPGMVPGVNSEAEAFDKENWKWIEEWRKAYGEAGPVPPVRPPAPTPA